jgi:hypothetical protein
MWQAGDLLRAAVERTRPYAQWMSLKLVWQDKLDSDLVVEADSRRIGHVLTNPLANAVKFSAPGGRIEVGARPVGGWREFCVSDTGVGIQPDQLVRLFERSYKRTRREPGLARARVSRSANTWSRHTVARFGLRTAPRAPVQRSLHVAPGGSNRAGWADRRCSGCCAVATQRTQALADKRGRRAVTSKLATPQRCSDCAAPQRERDERANAPTRIPDR